MKRFLLKCALFFFPIFVVLIAACAIDLALRLKTPFELPEDKTVLFIGDSHIELGINEKFIPCAFNNAKSRDFYMNMFPRIRKLIEANPQIRVVFIDTTPLSLAKGADQRTVKGYARELIQLNIPFYSSEELADSREATIRTFTDFRLFKKALWRILSGRSAKLEILGGFGEVERHEVLKSIQRGTKLDPDPNYGNALTVKYLRKIVEFARARGVRIIFLNPPLYHSREFFDMPYFENILKEKFPDVEFWDYADFPMPDKGFWDFNHLNGKGAEIFSKELAQRMQDEGIIDTKPETESH